MNITKQELFDVIAAVDKAREIAKLNNEIVNGDDAPYVRVRQEQVNQLNKEIDELLSGNNEKRYCIVIKGKIEGKVVYKEVYFDSVKEAKDYLFNNGRLTIAEQFLGPDPDTHLSTVANQCCFSLSLYDHTSDRYHKDYLMEVCI